MRKILFEVAEGLFKSPEAPGVQKPLFYILLTPRYYSIFCGWKDIRDVNTAGKPATSEKFPVPKVLT